MRKLIDRRDALTAGVSLAVVTFCPWVIPAYAQQTGVSVVGTVTRLQSAAVAMQNAVPRILSEGDQILLGDVISTGVGARVLVTMMDGSELTLGEATIFVVLEYVMSQTGGNAVMRLLEGAFLATSGSLLKQANSAFTIETEVATIGIRGTTFWGGPLDGKFSVLLLDGKGVFVETTAGRVDLTETGAGTTVPSSSTPPTPPKSWTQEKIARAKSTVLFAEN